MINMKSIKITTLKTDILIIGGGAAGCYAGVRIKEEAPETDVLIVDKANIKRSGCLAAGINAINAYLNPGVSARDFVDYVRKDSEGLVREDLLYTMAKGLNKATNWLESIGLPFIKDDQGNYIAKGRRSVKINGSDIKPIMAKAVISKKVKILNRVNITNYIIVDGQVRGAFGFSLRDNKFYVIEAKAVICATGGASGIYKANNPSAASHKIWYSPFNTGAGYAMGIRAGAEMTTFEMRFIALRTKDTISPTGTLAQGFKAKQVNAKGRKYQKDYLKNSTPYRLYATLQENLAGRGPCYLDARHISNEENLKLKKAYLSMSPSILLKWADEEMEPQEEAVELCGTEPYLVGGHAQAGYWVSTKRQTTLKGLYAAGDVAGGAPKKYVTGSMVEGELAGLAALDYIKNIGLEKVPQALIQEELQRVFAPMKRGQGYNPRVLEERLQKIMDEYAGGISQNYALNEEKLLKADRLLKLLKKDLLEAKAADQHQLLTYHEVVDRVIVARVLVKHLLYRQESRWPVYQSRRDYPFQDNKNWLKFVNSSYDAKYDSIKMIERELIKLGERDDS